MIILRGYALRWNWPHLSYNGHSVFDSAAFDIGPRTTTSLYYGSGKPVARCSLVFVDELGLAFEARITPTIWATMPGVLRDMRHAAVEYRATRHKAETYTDRLRVMSAELHGIRLSADPNLGTATWVAHTELPPDLAEYAACWAYGLRQWAVAPRKLSNRQRVSRALQARPLAPATVAGLCADRAARLWRAATQGPAT
jgi:hypothetical protein